MLVLRLLPAFLEPFPAKLPFRFQLPHHQFLRRLPGGTVSTITTHESPYVCKTASNYGLQNFHPEADR